MNIGGDVRWRAGIQEAGMLWVECTKEEWYVVCDGDPVYTR